jgi:hypothetical protein
LAENFDTWAHFTSSFLTEIVSFLHFKLGEIVGKIDLRYIKYLTIKLDDKNFSPILIPAKT